MLKQMLLDLDVEVREGWELIDIKEGEDSVTAFFDGGRSVTGSFLIGCDGIKAASRTTLLKNQGISEGLPVYTGLTQVSSLLPRAHCYSQPQDCRHFCNTRCSQRYLGDA